MQEQFSSQEGQRMEQAKRILEDKGIAPRALVRVEQANPGQEENWEFIDVIMQDGDPVAEVRKGDEVKYIAPGRLAQWQKQAPKSPDQNQNIYRGEGSVRQFNTVNEELKKGLEDNDR